MAKQSPAAEAIRYHLELRRRLPRPAMRRALRIEGGFTLARFAELFGVTRQAVSQWERGVGTPRGDQLQSYVEALELIAKELQVEASTSEVA